MDSLAALIAPMFALVALVLALLTLRTSRGLQRRLFLLLLAASLLPSMAVLAVAVRQSRQTLDLIDAPGLQASLDGALGLARTALADESASLSALADSVLALTSAERPPARPPVGEEYDRVSWAWTSAAGMLRQRQGEIDPEWLITQVVDSEPGTVTRHRLGEQEILVAVRTRGDSRLVVARPLPAALARDLAAVDAGSRGLGQLRLYYGELLRARTLFVAAATLLAVLLVSILASRVLARRLAEPVSDLVEGTRRVAAGQLDHRVRTQAVDELGELVVAFNSMTADLARGREQLRRSERIAAWQGIARRLAHEIKNPLTPIHLSLHRLRSRSDDPEVTEGLDTILQETRNLQRLADEFSLLARLPQPRRRPVDAYAVLQQVCQLYVPTTVELRWMGWDGLPAVQADEGQLRQVFGNLVKNAVEAMASRGVLRLSASAAGGTVEMAVHDDGPGLDGPAERIFEPDFTTKSSGTGLGLAIARRIVEDHGASIWAENDPGGGARIRLRWPAASSPEGEGEPS